MSSVEERLVIFAICFVISVPVSYVLLKNCVDINSRISIDFYQFLFTSIVYSFLLLSIDFV